MRSRSLRRRRPLFDPLKNQINVRESSLVAISALIVCLIFCPAIDASATTTSVPLQTRFGLSDSSGIPVVEVSLGRDRPVRLLLDTATVGIRVLASDLPTGSKSGIRLSSVPDTSAFLDGVALKGVIAYAPVSIGGVRTPPIPFELVTSQACNSQIGCPAFPGSGTQRVDGIFGASISRPAAGDPVVNPLMRLPSYFGGRWRIEYGKPLNGSSSGDIVLGALAPKQSVTAINLRSDGRTRWRGRYWEDRPTLCWTFNSQQRYCGPTIFDSGSDVMFIQSNPLPPELGITSSQPTEVPSGTTISVFERNSRRPFWSYMTGMVPDFDSAEARQRSPAFVDTGVQMFYSCYFTYNATSGSITVSNSQN